MWFGIPALVATGMTWSLVGIIGGSAPKRGLQMSIIQMVSSVVSLIIGGATLFATDTFNQNSFDAILYVVIFCGLSGVGNYTLIQYMSRAMQTGPNGIIWSIVQSGLIFPFTMGILIFNVPVNIWKILGIICLVTALILFGIVRNNDNNAQNKSWLLFAFTAFVICGFQQCSNSLPSYREDCSNLSVLKSVMNSIGVFIASLVGQLTGIERKVIVAPDGRHLTGLTALFGALRQHVRMPLLWVYIAMQQGFHIISAYFLMYKGMDAMTRAGLGNVCYPLLVSACIVGFFLYSTFFLKERIRPLQCLALILCLTGIVGICIKTPETPKKTAPAPHAASRA